MNIHSAESGRSTMPGLRVKGIRSPHLSVESIEIESTVFLIILAVLAALVAAYALVHI